MLENEKSIKLLFNTKIKSKSKLNNLLFSLIAFSSFFIISIIILSLKPNKIESDLKSFLPSDEKWDWSPKGDKIKTKWGKNLDPEKVWQEYPRPQLERKDWLNLNGAWSYSITQKDAQKPETPDGKILVPFPLESS